MIATRASSATAPRTPPTIAAMLVCRLFAEDEEEAPLGDPVTPGVAAPDPPDEPKRVVVLLLSPNAARGAVVDSELMGGTVNVTLAEALAEEAETTDDDVSEDASDEVNEDVED